MAGRLVSGEGLKGMRRLMLAVAGDDMREQPKPTPLQFLLSEGTQYITSYKISEKPLPDAMSVVFVIPRSREATGGAFFDGVLQCLRWKRPSDLWSIVPYIEAGDGEPPPPRDPEPAVLPAIPIRSQPRCAIPQNGWIVPTSGLESGAPQNTMAALSRGKRHVIVLSSSQESRIAGHGLIANMQGGRIPLQVSRSRPQSRNCRISAGAPTPLFRTGAVEEILR